jgi:hypothetical protein
MNSRPTKLASLLVAVTAAASLGTSGCFWQLGSHDEGSSSGTPTTTPAPVAEVAIDTGATLPVTPGGVLAVYVEYQGEGRWSMYTTCDSTVTGSACAFDLTVTPGSGSAFTAVTGSDLGSNDVLEQREDGVIHLSASTTSGRNGVTFETEPGALVRLGMLLDGKAQPQFIRAMSKGEVVYGFATDPVDFVPSVP